MSDEWILVEGRSVDSKKRDTKREHVNNPHRSLDDPLADSNLPLVFANKRHLHPIDLMDSPDFDEWRPVERMKTVTVALVMCLNIGVDPPDIIKPSPCAYLECWIDAYNLSALKAIEVIGATVQKQYECWQPRARYKQLLDPTVDEVRKLCISLRRNAKDERVLFHYNGHGVPKPTRNGEIWAFNRNFTQYIPISIYDLQNWIGAPSIFVYDCSNAGIIIDMFKKFANEHKTESSQENQHLQSDEIVNENDEQDLAEVYQPQEQQRQSSQPLDIRQPSQPLDTRLHPLLQDVRQPSQPHVKPEIAEPKHKSESTHPKVTFELPPQPEKPPLEVPPPVAIQQNPPERPPSEKTEIPYKNSAKLQDCIQLAACSRDEILPMNPELPADLFTCCLTAPIKTSFFYYTLPRTVSLLPRQISLDDLGKIPGQLNDRRTMLGELNWIFTAITDTIAWNTLPREQFQRLFRQDLLVASLFRNFLLAERIMRQHDCVPLSEPQLPPMHNHPMWNTWDNTLDDAVAQLETMLKTGNFKNYVRSKFFEHHLTSFENGLHLCAAKKKAPDYLPVILQVLLSQTHRIRALSLLSKFLDMGPWAVMLALYVGIFPYVLKLLQSADTELRPHLAFIWSKIIAVDKRTRHDLIRDKGHLYFIDVLNDETLSTKHRTYAAFILANIFNQNDEESIVAIKTNLLSLFLGNMIMCRKDTHMIHWLTICLAHLWQYQENVRSCALRDNAQEKLYPLLTDVQPEIRAAAVYALGTLLSSVCNRSKYANDIDQAIIMQLMTTVAHDISPMVRNELIVALQWIVADSESIFLSIANQEEMKKREMGPIHDRTLLRTKKLIQSNRAIGADTVDSPRASNDSLKRVSSSSSIASLPACSTTISPYHYYSPNILSSLTSLSFGTFHKKVWTLFNQLSKDPYLAVANHGSKIINYIRLQLNEWNLNRQAAIEASRLNSSISLPPSPNNRHNNAGASINTGVNTNNNSPPGLFVKNRLRGNNVPNTINEEEGSSSSTSTIGVTSQSEYVERQAMIDTKYFDWISAIFQHSMLDNDNYYGNSRTYGTRILTYDEEALFIRNWTRRKLAKVEQNSMFTDDKLNWESGVTRTSHTPTIMCFHPYEKHIAVAFGDVIGLYDWSRGVQISRCESNKCRQTTSKVTSIDWLNVHDHSLLLVASDDGSIKIRQAITERNCEPKIISAWQAYHGPVAPCNRQTAPSGMLTSWEQSTQTLITAGDSRLIRLWDLERELRLTEYQSGSEYSVTALDSSYSYSKHKFLLRSDEHSNWIAAGFGDGAIRLFDRRCSSQENRVKSWREHSAWIVDLKVSGDCIWAVCNNAFVHMFDIRKNSSVSSYSVSEKSGSHSFSAAFHPDADLFACVKNNQAVNFYKTNGNILDSITLHDSYFSQHVPSSYHLALHPKRLVFAVSNMNSSIHVYSPEIKKYFFNQKVITDYNLKNNLQL